MNYAELVTSSLSHKTQNLSRVEKSTHWLRFWNDRLDRYFLLVLRGILAGSRNAIAKNTTPNANAVTKI
jgi:hypothetical protein